MPKKAEISVQSFVNYNEKYVPLSSLNEDIKKVISQRINIKALSRLNEGYVVEKAK